MFPIPFNFPFRKKNGDLTTISEAISSGGSSYILPPATSETLGGIKVGSGLSIAEGVLSATSSGGGHCYLVNTNVTMISNVFLFTAYDGEINSADALMTALEGQGRTKRFMIPYSTKVLNSGVIQMQAIQSSATSIIIEGVKLENGAFAQSRQSVNKSSLTTVSSTKLW